MERGHAVVRGTLGGFLLVGFSHQHLYFRSDAPAPKTLFGARSERLVCRSGTLTSAYQCGRCGTLLIPPDGTAPGR